MFLLLKRVLLALPVLGFPVHHPFFVVSTIIIVAMTSSSTSSEAMTAASPLKFQSPLYTLASKSDSRTTADGEGSSTTTTPTAPGITALIILNSPITDGGEVLKHLWSTSSLRICADGGANRLKDYLESTGVKGMMPDRIVGDLDSLKDEVRQFFADQDVDIIQNPCQDTNDLDKAISSCQDQNVIDRILIYGAFGGRFDQEMASFQALYKWGIKYNYKLYLYCEDTFAFLVPGNNKACTIQLQQQSLEHSAKEKVIKICEGPTCGLIPLGGACDSVTTKGLKWDLTNQCTKFGELLSTSNRIVDVDNAQIYITSSHPIVFTAEIRKW